jgi:hypothetical protein
MTEEIKRLQNVTLQWVHEDVFPALKKCSEMRPDLMVSIKKVKADEELKQVQVRITINNVGKYQVTQKLVYFLCTSLTEYAPKNLN